jgi:hypothetical protein
MKIGVLQGGSLLAIIGEYEKDGERVRDREVDNRGVVEWLNRAKWEPCITKLQLEDIDISHPTVSIAFAELLCCDQREWMQVIFRACRAPEEIKRISTAKRKQQENCQLSGCCCNPDSLRGTLACALARVEDIQIRADTNFTQQPCFFLVPSRPINCQNQFPNLKRLRLLQQFDIVMTTSLAHCLQQNSALKELDLSFSRFLKSATTTPTTSDSVTHLEQEHCLSGTCSQSRGSDKDGPIQILGRLGLQTNRQLQVLNLQWCLLDDMDIISLCRSLCRHPTLRTLNLATNRCSFSNLPMTAIASLIQQDKNCFIELDLSDQRPLRISENDSNQTIHDENLHWIPPTVVLDLKPLATALLSFHCHIERLDLHSNHLVDDHVVLLAKALALTTTRSVWSARSSPSLKHLNLRNNDITDRGVFAFAQALQTNPNRLHTLCLTENPFIGLKGVRAMENMLKGNQRLEFLGMDIVVVEDPGEPYPPRNELDSETKLLVSETTRIAVAMESIRYLTLLNRGGRRLLQEPFEGTGNCPMGLWPILLARVNCHRQWLLLDSSIMTGSTSPTQVFLEQGQGHRRSFDVDEINENPATAPINNGNVIKPPETADHYASRRATVLYYLLRQGPILLHRYC